MKKLILLLISLSFLSCSLDDGRNDITYHSEFVPIETAIVPDFFNYGEDNDITVTYIRPNTCYAFDDIYYRKDGFERTVAVVNTVYENASNCEEVLEETETTFTVRATQEENYIFHFWQGVDDNGEDIYLTIEVPVIQ